MNYSPIINNSLIFKKGKFEYKKIKKAFCFLSSLELKILYNGMLLMIWNLITTHKFFFETSFFSWMMVYIYKKWAYVFFFSKCSDNLIDLCIVLQILLTTRIIDYVYLVLSRTAVVLMFFIVFCGRSSDCFRDFTDKIFITIL